MVSKNVKIVIAIVVAVIVVGTAFAVLYHPAKPVFTDVSQTAAPEQLDPATGFFTTNGPLFSALFQELVEFNGSSDKVVPILAQNYTIHNDQNYTFNLRTDAKFSNNQALNATSIWFSFYRGLIMGQGPYASNYGGILFNSTIAAECGIDAPVGIVGALDSAGYHIPDNGYYNISGKLTHTKYANYTVAAMDLDNILSHFNYNATEMKVMEYKNQALVVNSNYNVSINTMQPYPFLLQDIAGWWGAIVEPSYIDAHDGVVYNSPNPYIDLHSAIGSGPYVITSVGKGFSTITLSANPNYWVNSTMVSNHVISKMAQPAIIKNIVIKYGLNHADRVETFDKNESQISTVSPSSFKNIINGFYDKSEANSKLVKAYPVEGTFFISMNTQRSYTDNTHFREALYDALNYSQEMAIYNNNYNGSAEAYLELGPVSPLYGHAYYNPNNYPLPKQNLTYAIQNLTLAGKEMKFYVTLPNGTEIGDKSGTDLSTTTFTLTGISPPTAIETDQLTIAIDSFKLIGLTFDTKYVTESAVSGWTSPSATPHFVDLGWLPDYPDPIGQQLIAVYDAEDGGAFGGNDAWVDNSTLQTIFTTLDFENATTQEKEMYEVQNLTYNQYAYMWLPMPYTVYFVQPYLHGFTYNEFTGYYYNLMYISYNTSSTASVMPAYLAMVSTFMAGVKFD